jgi:hypothetical protein
MTAVLSVIVCCAIIIYCVRIHVKWAIVKKFGWDDRMFDFVKITF